MPKHTLYIYKKTSHRTKPFKKKQPLRICKARVPAAPTWGKRKLAIRTGVLTFGLKACYCLQYRGSTLLYPGYVRRLMDNYV